MISLVPSVDRTPGDVASDNEQHIAKDSYEEDDDEEDSDDGEEAESSPSDYATKEIRSKKT